MSDENIIDVAPVETENDGFYALSGTANSLDQVCNTVARLNYALHDRTLQNDFASFRRRPEKSHLANALQFGIRIATDGCTRVQ